MRLCTLAFLFGILVCQTFTFLPDTRWTIWLFPLLILVPILPSRWRIIIFFILGMLWTIWRADMILAQKLPAELEGQEITIIFKEGHKMSVLEAGLLFMLFAENKRPSDYGDYHSCIAGKRFIENIEKVN